MDMLENIEVLYHSCIKFNYDKKIYVDPFGIKYNYNDADIILITHSHFDHFSKEDIEKVKKENTIILVPKDLYNKLLELNYEYEILEIKIKTVPAYNINKTFHPKENNWVRLYNKFRRKHLLYSR